MTFYMFLCAPAGKVEKCMFFVIVFFLFLDGEQDIEGEEYED